MRVGQIVLTRVAYIQNVRDAQSIDHFPILGMLPFAEIEFLREHFIAKFFSNFGLWGQRLLVLISDKVSMPVLKMLKSLQADVCL